MNDTTRPVNVLAVLASAADRDSLRAIIRHSHWTLRFAERLDEVHEILEAGDVGVVLSDCALPGGDSWKDLLRTVEATVPACPFIVTDRLADERLWAEVLNLGAYDLLAKPFDAEEVFRVVSLAWQSWRSRVERVDRMHKPAASETGRDQRVRIAGRG